MSLTELDKTYVAGTYNRFPVELVSGKGSLLYDTAGKEYVDMGSGIGVTAFGIADDIWKAAVTEQLGKVQHTSNLYYTEPCARLAELLCLKTGMKKVFFGNSGAEANECAVKVARKYSAETKGPDCNIIVTLKNSFHGRTLTTLAATGQEHYHELYQPLTPGFVHVETGKPEQFEELAAAGKVAGLLMECIQGEGGVKEIGADYAREMETICRKYDIPLMIDEVQTGNGRTGALYAYMNYGLKPDIVSTAKGLAGGLPLGACLMGEKVSGVLGFGDHGSTFGGNPVCCAAALSVLERLDESFLAEVCRKAELLRRRFEGAEGILSVSGMGLMVGLQTVRPAPEILSECIENGVLCLTAKDRIRLLPALNIPDELLMRAADVICAAAKKGV